MIHSFAAHGLQLGSLAPELVALALLVAALATARTPRPAWVAALALALNGFLQASGPAHVHAQPSAGHAHGHVEHHQHVDATGVIDVEQPAATAKPGFDSMVETPGPRSVAAAAARVGSRPAKKVPLAPPVVLERPPASIPA